MALVLGGRFRYMPQGPVVGVSLEGLAVGPGTVVVATPIQGDPALPPGAAAAVIPVDARSFHLRLAHQGTAGAVVNAITVLLTLLGLEDDPDYTVKTAHAYILPG